MNKVILVLFGTLISATAVCSACRNSHTTVKPPSRTEHGKKMDIEKRNKVIERIFAEYDRGIQNPMMTLDDFFNGNTAESSIAPNAIFFGRVPLARIEQILRTIESRPDVESVYITVHECPSPSVPEDDTMWVVAGTAIITTSTPYEQVCEWVSELSVTSVGAYWPSGTSPEIKSPSDAATSWGLFWD